MGCLVMSLAEKSTAFGFRANIGKIAIFEQNSSLWFHCGVMAIRLHKDASTPAQSGPGITQFRTTGRGEVTCGAGIFHRSPKYGTA
jgi:hypothetical protein